MWYIIKVALSDAHSMVSSVDVNKLHGCCILNSKLNVVCWSNLDFRFLSCQENRLWEQSCGTGRESEYTTATHQQYKTEPRARTGCGASPAS